MTNPPGDDVSAPTPAGRPTVSWAQNHEDIVLARGLSAPTGFYVDIGAYDPDVESVTKLFYDRGWRGINVEPVAAFIDRFEIERPRDINICAAIAEHDGEMDLWVSPDVVPGHSTLHADIAEAHREDGQDFVARRVRSLRLDTLLNTYVPPGLTIDFLKIDVEGAEGAVLASWDPTTHRPRVIVVEAMAPHVEGSTHEQWEHLLTDAGYRLALFDGLNRFYVGAGDHELGAVLGAPANVFDVFEPAAHRELRDFTEALHAELTQWKSWATSLDARVKWLESRLAQHGDPASRTG